MLLIAGVGGAFVLLNLDILVACLRDNGLDLPDPQFGPEGVRFADPSVMMSIDFRSSEFLDAMEACQSLLEALQPEIDAAQQAEQNERLLVFAECMRGEGIDFPDPELPTTAIRSTARILVHRPAVRSPM